MNSVVRTLAGVCATLIVVACTGSDGSGATTTTVLQWRDYEPGLQAKIDAMAAAKDCDGMQLEFNEIGGTNLAVRNKTGHGNEAVLEYIDAKERAAGCFPSTVGSTIGS